MRVLFSERKQEEGEGMFRFFYVPLKKLADESDLCQLCLSLRLTTQIMSGVISQEVRQK